MAHVLADLTMDAALSQDPDSDLLGAFNVADADMEPLYTRKTIYLSAPFVGIFLDRYIVPAEAWTRFRSAIVDRGQ